MKEQIAARRAAMRKGLASSTSATSAASTVTAKGGVSTFSTSTRGGSGLSDWGPLGGPDDTPTANVVVEDADDLLGRPTVRQAVIKALNTGETVWRWRGNAMY